MYKIKHHHMFNNEQKHSVEIPLQTPGCRGSLLVKEARCFCWWRHQHVGLVLVSYMNLEFILENRVKMHLLGISTFYHLTPP